MKIKKILGIFHNTTLKNANHIIAPLRNQHLTHDENTFEIMYQQHTELWQILRDIRLKHGDDLSACYNEMSIAADRFREENVPVYYNPWLLPFTPYPSFALFLEHALFCIISCINYIWIMIDILIIAYKLTTMPIAVMINGAELLNAISHSILTGTEMSVSPIEHIADNLTYYPFCILRLTLGIVILALQPFLALGSLITRSAATGFSFLAAKDKSGSDDLPCSATISL